MVRAEDLAKQAVKDGCRRIILTDIKRDGMQTGPNTELLAAVAAAVPIPIVQSGGIGSLDHLRLLMQLGPSAPEGVIIGRALYEGSFGLPQALEVASGVVSGE